MKENETHVLFDFTSDSMHCFLEKNIKKIFQRYVKSHETGFSGSVRKIQHNGLPDFMELQFHKKLFGAI